MIKNFFLFFLVIILFFEAIVFCIIYLNKDILFFTRTASLGSFVSSNVSEAGENNIGKENNINEPEKERSSEKKYNVSYPDFNIEGQLVRHLFDIKGVPSPKGVAFSKDNKEVWVTSLLNKSRGVIVFDSLTGEKIKDINLEGGGGVEVIFSADGKRVYVSQMETAKVFEIDVDSKDILRVFNTGGIWTKVLVISPDGKIIFASNWSSNNISEIDIQSGDLLRKISVVNTPRSIYIAENGKTLYVAGFDNGEIEKIDLATGRGEVIFETGGAMRHIAGDEEKGVLYFSDMAKGVIWQLFLATGEVKKFAETDNNPNTIVLSPDKKILFVSCRGINFSADNYFVPGPEWGSVLLLDTESGEMLDAIVAGNQPTALDVSSDGKILVFSDFLDAKLEVFEVPSYEVLKEGCGGRSKNYKEELKK